MLVKYKDLVLPETLEAFYALSQEKNLSLKTKAAVARLLVKVKSEAEIFEKLRLEIVNKYLDEAEHRTGERPKEVPSEAIAECAAEIRPLLDVEAEVGDPIKIEGDLEMDAGKLSLLLQFIDVGAQ